MGLHYAPDVRNASASNRAPEGWTEREWHQSAIGDTHTSHSLPGRLYIVQCEWCDEAFAAHTKAEAVAMFREHESDMLDSLELAVRAAKVAAGLDPNELQVVESFIDHLPDKWQREFWASQLDRALNRANDGPCNIGPCSALKGHAGTCAEASGWDE